MGLDMYLTKRRYVKNWDYMKPLERHTVTVRKGGKAVTSKLKVAEIIYDAAYWRKANAIHQWFVDNVQGGEDDCKEYYVDADKLETLLSLVNQVLDASELVSGKIANGYTFEQNADGETVRKPIMEDGKYIKDSSVAEQLLPTTEGFFFGSTQYDEYYYSDLVETRKMLELALSEKDGDYYYRASW